MKVETWMRRMPVTITPETRVAEALRLCRERQVRRLPVVKDGRVVGVVREADLLRLTPSEATTLDRYELMTVLERIAVARIVTRAVIVAPEISLAEAARRLGDGAEELLVVAEGALSGILTRSDCLRGLLAASMAGGQAA